jgi:hypothetical protein
MPQFRSSLRPLSGSALGLLLLVPAALFTSASLLKYAVGMPVATLSLVLLAMLAGYAVAENLAHS